MRTTTFLFNIPAGLTHKNSTEFFVEVTATEVLKGCLHKIYIEMKIDGALCYVINDLPELHKLVKERAYQRFTEDEIWNP